LHRLVFLTSTVAVLLTGVLLASAWAGLEPSGPPLAAAGLSRDLIRPNSASDEAATRIRYRLVRPASISIYFEDDQGQRYYFRRDRLREAGEHEVDFRGVVEAYQVAEEPGVDGLQTRVLRDGEYRWIIEVDDSIHPPQQASGALAVREADTSLPLLLNMTVNPPVFTPNQDGISDRVTINVWLDKDVAADGLRVYLVDGSGRRLPIAERVTNIRFGERGLHTYDYDAGIDLGVEPPPDGEYTVLAVAVDRLGQRVVAQRQLTIAMGGLPRADIRHGEVEWSASSVVLGSTLYFTLTVENYGTAPIRTSGPFAGYIYESMSVNANTIGEYEQSGAWRVGIHCQTCKSDYPWRWALGTPATLTLIPDESGQPQYYLMPGEMATVSGGVVLDEVVASRNPQYFWAGLIHEDVAIAEVNNRVDPREVRILDP
jgi:hypothetical protein